jgi:hypothetical protein
VDGRGVPIGKNQKNADKEKKFMLYSEKRAVEEQKVAEEREAKAAKEWVEDLGAKLESMNKVIGEEEKGTFERALKYVMSMERKEGRQYSEEYDWFHSKMPIGQALSEAMRQFDEESKKGSSEEKVINMYIRTLVKVCGSENELKGTIECFEEAYDSVEVKFSVADSTHKVSVVEIGDIEEFEDNFKIKSVSRVYLIVVKGNKYSLTFDSEALGFELNNGERIDTPELEIVQAKIKDEYGVCVELDGLCNGAEELSIIIDGEADKHYRRVVEKGEEGYDFDTEKQCTRFIRTFGKNGFLGNVFVYVPGFTGIAIECLRYDGLEEEEVFKLRHNSYHNVGDRCVKANIKDFWDEKQVEVAE